MKKIIALAIGAMSLVSCCKQADQAALTHTDWAYNATIYELNTRQLTPEGTFAAAERVLPQLKENGVDIVWIMPCQPIGEITRKGSLGSYYSIVDYCQMNPEFGTREDFEHLLKSAHDLGLKVILDWVANHTAPDSKWTQNDGWHYRDSAGNLMVQYDWTDISKLNYDNQDMRQEMLKCMRWWMDSIGIDGFRCDVAGEVPTDFWNWAMGDLRKDYPNMFTLAEDEAKADELTESAFDMYYGWELHHIMNEVAQGKKTAEDMWAYFEKCDTTVRANAIRMNFITNHDENSWSGTEQERMGDAQELMTALCYVAPGMPLIYSGQLSGNHHRLEFFEKDLIDTDEAYAQADLYKQLNTLREENPALWAPELGGKMVRLEADNKNVFACVRAKECKKCGNNTVIALMNMSGEEQQVSVELGELAGEYKCLCGKNVELEATYSTTMKPWQYCILVK